MEDRRTKLLPKILLGQSLVTLFIVALSMSIILYADGYKVNWHTMKLIRSGGIYLSVYPKQANVYINNKLLKKKSPTANLLVPGQYNIRVEKDGYYTWSSTEKVVSGQVNNYRNLVLFKSNPEIIETTDSRRIDQINSPNSELAKPKDLFYSEYEIWVGSDLITRFSTPIQKAIWYPDEAHIVYQQSNEIKVMDINGKNSFVLAKLSSSNPTGFAINYKGDELGYRDNGKYYIARIRQ